MTTTKSQADTSSFTDISVEPLWSEQLHLLKFILKVLLGADANIWCLRFGAMSKP